MTTGTAEAPAEGDAHAIQRLPAGARSIGQPGLPSLIIGVTALLALAAAAAIPFLETADALVIGEVSQGAAALGAVGALVVGMRGPSREACSISRWLALAIGAAAGGILAQRLGLLSGMTPAVGQVLSLVALAILIGAVTPAVARRAPRGVLLAAGLDALVLLAAGTAIAGLTWAGIGGETTGRMLAALFALVALVSWTGVLVLLLLARAIQPSVGGAYAVVAGTWLIVIADLGRLVETPGVAHATTGALTGLLFCLGVLVAAHGGVTWSMAPGPARRAGPSARIRDAAPTLAVMSAIVLEMTAAHEGSWSAAMRIAVVVSVLMAGLRQLMLKAYERRAKLAATAADARLAREVEGRDQVSAALSGMGPGATAAETAGRICERLMGLTGVAFAILLHADGASRFSPLATAGSIVPWPVARKLPAVATTALAARLTPEAVSGGAAWLEPLPAWLADRCGPGSFELAGGLLPCEDDRMGLLVLLIGCEPAPTDAIGRRLASVRQVMQMAVALVGPVHAAEETRRILVAAVDAVIAGEAFHPVFQPIVDLATGSVRGYEALTRFDDLVAPDLHFRQAAQAGRGVEMEVATLGAALRHAVNLPEGCYLSLNVSPELANRPERLGPLLTRHSRELLLELTEHAPVEDYEVLMASLYALDIRVRIAVDDAGSGYAGLHHILAVRPHVVKLDLSLVRAVDRDLARQALVGAMASFARQTGATIIAEGIETEEEEAMLRRLGVQMGQGYLFGRPVPVPLPEPGSDVLRIV